jgi:hypothetical protein
MAYSLSKPGWGYPFPMGVFTYRYVGPSSDPSVAIQKALMSADANGVVVSGSPVVKRRHVPIPLLGPRTKFVVTFDRATRSSPNAA